MSDQQQSADLTLQEQATNFATMQHIALVTRFLHEFVTALLDRANYHDCSKLSPPEVGLFTLLTPKLAATTYMSEEYKGYLKDLGVALEHHYRHNRHHPEHFKDGVAGMNLIDLVEMFCDWKAATMRHRDGDLVKSIQRNAVRFDLSPQLVSIFMNTAEWATFLERPK